MGLEASDAMSVESSTSCGGHYRMLFAILASVHGEATEMAWRLL
jgi:hypothetical protein